MYKSRKQQNGPWNTSKGWKRRLLWRATEPHVLIAHTPDPGTCGGSSSLSISPTTARSKQSFSLPWLLESRRRWHGAVGANEVNIVPVIQEQQAHPSRSASWDALPRGAPLPPSHLIPRRLGVPVSLRHSVDVLKYGCSNLVTLIRATQGAQRFWRIYLSGGKCAGSWMFGGVICSEIKAAFLTSYLVSHEPHINVT